MCEAETSEQHTHLVYVARTRVLSRPVGQETEAHLRVNNLHIANGGEHHHNSYMIKHITLPKLLDLVPFY